MLCEAIFLYFLLRPGAEERFNSQLFTSFLAGLPAQVGPGHLHSHLGDETFPKTTPVLSQVHQHLPPEGRQGRLQKLINASRNFAGRVRPTCTQTGPRLPPVSEPGSAKLHPSILAITSCTSSVVSIFPSLHFLPLSEKPLERLQGVIKGTEPSLGQSQPCTFRDGGDTRAPGTAVPGHGTSQGIFSVHLPGSGLLPASRTNPPKKSTGC